MKTAFLFPGQGAQQVGMGKDLCDAYPAAMDIFDRAEQACGIELKKFCFDGPEDDLSRTDICQPAIFTHSAAVLAAMRDQLGQRAVDEFTPDVLAGLSLGEYTALFLSGAMDFETGVKLVAARGKLMQEAALETPSGMVALIGMDEEKVAELCSAASEGQVLSPANFNCPGQIVISGQKDACQRAAEMADKFGARASAVLKVAGAFHSELMASAAEKFKKVLDEVEFSALSVPVISNVDAKPYDCPCQIPTKLLAQLVKPVRWQQCVEFILAGGAEKFYEIGPGKVLAGLMRRINRKADMTSVNSAGSIEKLVGP